VRQLYSATPVFNVCVPVLFKRLSIQYKVMASVMDLISFSVASRIERGLPYVCFSPVNAVREREKSLHVAIGFTLALHGHTSRSRR